MYLVDYMTFVAQKLFCTKLLLLSYRYATPRVQWETTSDEEAEVEDPFKEGCDAKGQELQVSGAEER